MVRAMARATARARKSGDGDACKRMKMNIDGEWVGWLVGMVSIIAYVLNHLAAARPLLTSPLIHLPSVTLCRHEALMLSRALS